ncbi:MAG: hypothetical protein CBC16_10960 [Verrucomicrobia bacterium TMED56]|nr:MAG: hypothetical protein CBC16_10960 [Verrucomicrobia bacterium TMED56]
MGGRKALAMTRLLTPSLGSFGPAGLPPCLGQDSPRSLALLAFLETNTEAKGAEAAARVEVVALG